MRAKLAVGILLLMVAVAGVWSVGTSYWPKLAKAPPAKPVVQTVVINLPEHIDSPQSVEAEPVPLPKFVNLPVPFTVQAPFADWQDPRQEDACEEASALMAVYWAQEKTLTKD